MVGLAIKGFGIEDPDYWVEAHLKALDEGVIKAFLKLTVWIILPHLNFSLSAVVIWGDVKLGWVMGMLGYIGVKLGWFSMSGYLLSTWLC